MILLLSVFFSLMAPGAGHILIGDYWQGLILGGLFALGKSALLPLAIRIGKIDTVKSVLQFFYVCNMGYILLILYALASAAWSGFYAQEMHVLQALVFIFAVILVYKRTQNKFIFTALCGRSGIYELMMKMRKSQKRKIEK